MLSKKERALQALRSMPGLRCPLCGQSLAIKADETGLCCINRHSFDLSRKGYVNLAGTHRQTMYNQALFEARSRVFQAGFYEETARALLEEAAPPEGGGPVALLDAGCGEGYYLAWIMSHSSRPVWGAGVDLSREAVQAATERPVQAFWAVADLRALPFADGCLDGVLDVMTPANYEEFFRVLKPKGKLYKVYPGNEYLRELRSAMGFQPYDGAQVRDYLNSRTRVEKERRVLETYPVTPAQYRDFVWMTPLTEGLCPEEKEALARRPAETITVDLHLAVVIRKEGSPL